MCDFFSVTSDGKGNIKYFNWKQRGKIINNEEGYKGYVPDSHTSINDFYGYRGAAEDKRNKYEYNPLTGKFTIDTINTYDDSEEVKARVRELDMKTIVEPLIIKKIVHPFRDVEKVKEITEEHIKLLEEWISVRDSIMLSIQDSVKDSVKDSVWNSVWNSVKDSVEDSVWNSVRNSVWNSVGNSVRNSVRYLVEESVRDSVYVYISSFFKLDEWKYIDHKNGVNPSQSCIDLWEMGLVPSFDGEVWRLHSGVDGGVVYEMKK